jgi:hypothetical protein
MTHDEAEDIKRHFNVIAEGLRSDIRLVAEGHAGLDRKIDGVRQELHEFRGEARSEIRLVAEGQEALRQDAADFRLEVQGEFRDVRALIRLSYTELEDRVKLVERELVSLKARLEEIEGQHS